MSWEAAARGLQTATGLVTGINTWAEFFNCVSSAISSARSWISIQQRADSNYVHQMQEEMRRLQGDLWQLQTTLPKMRDLTERLEWQIYKKPAAELLPHIKDAVLDAEDIIDEFNYFELKAKMEGRMDECQTSSTFQEFYKSVIRGSFNRLKEIQEKLDHLHRQSVDLGLQGAAQRFDKFVRPETSSFLNDSKVFGRQEEEKMMLELLGVPVQNYAGYRRKRSSRVDILPIVGLGGVGKTTLAQQICKNQRVKAHFDMILWACVSDEFNAKRLTKEVIQSSNKEVLIDNLDCLQSILKDTVESKRFLLVLDDIWDDVMVDGGQEWQRFCAPLSNALQGSKILITTRSQKVADKVRTMDSFLLEGLNEDVFWEFFIVQAFGSEGFHNYPELEAIGRNIILKLKGSPLAAKTIGRLLRTNMHTAHWNNILHSELWRLEQERTDILPALRLSYMYLPPHLKRCFSFCAVYPKDYMFEKDTLVDIWLAEGFVEHASGVAALTVGQQYFEELLSRSFFQKVSVTHDKYVIHDLMHDMAQLVSQDECFIVRDVDDLRTIPPNVRHLSIFSKRYIICHDLMGLCRHKKLRTLLCGKSVGQKDFASLLGSWFKDLQHIRVLSSTLPMLGDIPEGISSLKLVAYLCFSSPRSFTTFPSSLCTLYNLQTLDASACVFKSLPSDFYNLISLRKFRAKNFSYLLEEDLRFQFLTGERTKVLKHINQIHGNLLVNLHSLMSKKNIGLAVLKKENDIYSLQIKPLEEQACYEQGEQLEIYKTLHPHPNLGHLEVTGYQGEDFCPSWFLPANLPNMTSLIFEECYHTKKISLYRLPSIGFRSLINLYIIECKKLSDIEQFLQPCHMPAMKMISIKGCQELTSVSAETFGGFHSLEGLVICDCPRISWENGIAFPSSLKRLSLVRCGDICKWIPDCLLNLSSLVRLQLVGLSGTTFIPASVWQVNLPLLDYLEICNFQEFLAAGVPEAIAGINNVLIDKCPMLKELRQPFCRGDATFLWGIPTSKWLGM